MGGADRFNLALVAGLDKSRFEVAVLTTVPSGTQMAEHVRGIYGRDFPSAGFSGSSVLYGICKLLYPDKERKFCTCDEFVPGILHGSVAEKTVS